MKVVLLVGDHGFRAPRARTSVATALGSRLPARLGAEAEGLVVLDRTTTSRGGSRAVLDLALGSLLDLDRIRGRAETADLYVTMNIADGISAGCNPFDWMTRWLRIEATARSLGWSARLVWLGVGEDAPKETRRFERRIARALEAAKIPVLRVEQIEWRDRWDVGSMGALRIAEAIERDLELVESIPVVRRGVAAPSVVG